MKESKFVQNILVELDEHELRERGELLAQTMKKADDKEAEFSLVKGEFKKALKEIYSEASRLAQVVRARAEERPIDVVKSFDESRGLVSITRIDTGTVVETRPPTDEELQEDMLP